MTVLDKKLLGLHRNDEMRDYYTAPEEVNGVELCALRKFTAFEDL